MGEIKAKRKIAISSNETQLLNPIYKCNCMYFKIQDYFVLNIFFLDVKISTEDHVLLDTGLTGYYIILLMLTGMLQQLIY